MPAGSGDCSIIVSWSGTSEAQTNLGQNGSGWKANGRSHERPLHFRGGSRQNRRLSGTPSPHEPTVFGNFEKDAKPF